MDLQKIFVIKQFVCNRTIGLYYLGSSVADPGPGSAPAFILDSYPKSGILVIFGRSWIWDPGSYSEFVTFFGVKNTKILCKLTQIFSLPVKIFKIYIFVKFYGYKKM